MTVSVKLASMRFFSSELARIDPGLLAQIDPLPCSSVVLSMSAKVAR
jgi:hypothetical protein